MAFGDKYWWVLTSSYFAHLEGYLDVVSAGLRQEHQKLKARVEQLAAEAPDYDEESWELFYEQFQGEFAWLRDDLPRQFFSDFIVAFHSTVEKTFVQFCQKLGIDPSKDNDPNAWKKLSDIDRYKRKIEAAKDGFTFDKSLWEEIDFARLTRNRIVHNEGQFGYFVGERPVNFRTFTFERHGHAYHVELKRSESPAYMQYLIKHGIMNEETVPDIIPTLPYCEHLIRVGRNFFFAAYKSLGLMHFPDDN